MRWIRAPFKELVTWLSEGNFECVEIVDCGLHTLNYGRAQQLRQVLKGAEVSVHAPWFGIDLSTPIRPSFNVMLKTLEKSLRNAFALEASVWVVHCGARDGFNSFYPGYAWKSNLEAMRRLHRVARNYGIRVGLENLWQADLLADIGEIIAFFRDLDRDVGLTLDVGHAHLMGHATLFLDALKDRIIHMHVSDNDGVEDKHWEVGKGNIDWQSITNKTRENNFDGMMIVECFEGVNSSVVFLKKLFRGE